jgi:hypothetical protein
MKLDAMPEQILSSKFQRLRAKSCMILFQNNVDRLRAFLNSYSTLHDLLASFLLVSVIYESALNAEICIGSTSSLGAYELLLYLLLG